MGSVSSSGLPSRVKNKRTLNTEKMCVFAFFIGLSGDSLWLSGYLFRVGFFIL